MNGTSALVACLLALPAGVLAQQETPPQERTVEEQKTMRTQDPAFVRLDADRDGRISAAEANADTAFALAFHGMDTDHDGSVTSAEFNAPRKPAPPTTAQGATKADVPQVDTHESFSGLDTDKDGRVSAAESGKNASDFEAMDTNGDGFVSDAEYRAQSKAAGRMDEGKPATQ
ncbi:hypothetical protein LVB87_03090 [Lysobacter sp. KIS68-7]|uniref:EF-hand domain-containing protein n=1 Tax=Lysobacter sp. KIS68-7 TaxID=2904252 RepID=UPI001E42BAD1|nr:hypothetical protein [Lysobacter sp. KIS68-7]UHQ20161.1 hypothetical protein LVB87_03090 [Lysobacter sp. KIS68-7]